MKYSRGPDQTQSLASIHGTYAATYPLNLPGARVRGAMVPDGEQIAAQHVAMAIDPQTALLDLVGEEHLSLGSQTWKSILGGSDLHRLTTLS